MHDIFQKNAKSLLLSIQSSGTNILTGCLRLLVPLSPTHTQMKKKNENFTEHDTFIDIQKITFSKKFQKQTKFFMLNEKCVLSYCKAFWHVPKHRFKFNLLNFHFDHFRFLSTKLEALVNSQWQRKFCWMKWQRKSWNGQTLQKISAKSDQPLLSPSRNKITIGFAWI